MATYTLRLALYDNSPDGKQGEFGGDRPQISWGQISDCEVMVTRNEWLSFAICEQRTIGHVCLVSREYVANILFPCSPAKWSRYRPTRPDIECPIRMQGGNDQVVAKFASKIGSA